MLPAMELPTDIFALNGPVVLFPVRHHSPTAAVMVREVIRSLRPKAVLVEGPSDFNGRMGELELPHELPIAVYSYVRLGDGRRRGAYYPFCVYSPEWQALLAARGVGAKAEFIDLPYADVAPEDERSNRYADADLRRSAYVRELCRRLGVDGFDAVWDRFFELERGMTPEAYMERAHRFCGQIRLVEGQVREVDWRREAFMARQVRRAVEEVGGGPVVVVTGGYHSLGLHAHLHGSAQWEEDVEEREEGEERGIAITPYSYERLDSLTGYDAGMPNPGYYHRLWQDRQAGKPIAHRKLIFDVAKALREKKQRVSSADLIAAESCATALSRLRGHGEVWRTDLVDGLVGALVKDELEAGGSHPLLDAIHKVLRGDERGSLAEGAPLPPLVREIQRLLAEAGLRPETRPREVEIDLCVEAEREKSRLLHRLRVLGVAAFERVGGTDFAAREDLSRLWERWGVQWSPEYDSSAVEASRYGPTLMEAAANRLAERAQGVGRSAQQATVLLLEASLAGLNDLAATLHARLEEVVDQDGAFASVTAALSHLLYLHQFDETMGTRGRGDVGRILKRAFARGLWLLESLGQVADAEGKAMAGVAGLLDAFERCERLLGLDRVEFVEVFQRVAADGAQGPAVRGAAVGALWVLGEADAAGVRGTLKLFADPQRLGDFLAGLFSTAREVVQREAELLLSVDSVLAGYGDDEFLAALPALRLAFTYFTPREKHHMAASLLEALGVKPAKQLAALRVSAEEAARALAEENALFAALALYKLRGGEEAL